MQWLKMIGRAVLTPAAFSYYSVHFRSSLKGAAVDRYGVPIPWYTYSSIWFLQQKKFSGKTVLEFGAGQSTSWWAQRADKVVAFERNQGWYERLKSVLPKNVELYFDPKGDMSGFEEVLRDRRFDVIVIDGQKREKCAEVAPDLLAPAGAILIDNSEGYGSGGRKSIVDPFRELGFSRVDFYGHAPAVLRPHCTSLLFREKCFLLDSEESPAVLSLAIFKRTE